MSEFNSVSDEIHGADKLPQSGRTVRRRNRRKNRRTYAAAGAVVLVLLIVFTVLGLKGCFSRSDAFEGTWDLDGVTVYRFDGFGKGAMVLPTAGYDFVYTADEEAKTVHIDFVNEKVNDYTYTYEVSDEVLILSGGNEEGTFAYTFRKVE